jgi:hypothetical protein
MSAEQTLNQTLIFIVKLWFENSRPFNLESFKDGAALALRLLKSCFTFKDTAPLAVLKRNGLL